MGIAMLQLSVVGGQWIDLGDIGSNVKVRAVVLVRRREYVGSNDNVIGCRSSGDMGQDKTS